MTGRESTPANSRRGNDELSLSDEMLATALVRDFHPIHPNERFSFMVSVWDISRAWIIVNKWQRSTRRKRVTRVAIPKTTLDLVIIDERRAMTGAIDITIPCLVARVENQPLIIDGWHRLFKAKQLGYDWLYGFHLTEAESRKVRIR